MGKNDQLTNDIMEQFTGYEENVNFRGNSWNRTPFPDDFDAWDVVINENGDTVAHAAAMAEVKLPQEVLSMTTENNDGKTVSDIVLTTNNIDDMLEIIPDDFGIEFG